MLIARVTIGLKAKLLVVKSRVEVLVPTEEAKYYIFISSFILLTLLTSLPLSAFPPWLIQQSQIRNNNGTAIMSKNRFQIKKKRNKTMQGNIGNGKSTDFLTDTPTF